MLKLFIYNITFIFIFILSVNLGFTQTSYKTNIELYFHAHENDGHGMCETRCRFFLVYESGNQELVYDNGENYEIYQPDLNYITIEKVVGVRVIGHAKRENYLCYRCSCKGDASDLDSVFYFDSCQRYSGSYTANSDAAEVDGWFRAFVTPIHTLAYPTILGFSNSADTFLPADDKVTMRAKTGFASSLYNYQYKFSTEPESSYVNINPSLSNLNELSVSAIDLFGLNGWEIHSGKYINFRVVSCPEGNSYASKSLPITLRIVQSAPHILPLPPPLPLKCFDSTDGKIRVKLDRSALNDEKLGYNLLNINNLTIPVRSFPNVGTPNFPVLDEDNSFEITGLSAGTYILKLGPGFYSNIVTYATGINHSKSYTINKPDPVSFTIPATAVTNVNCNGGSDGTIKITAAGGSPIGAAIYQYRLNQDPWKPFVNGNEHSITGLMNDNYTIQVKDANDCVAKNVNGNEIIKDIEIKTVLQAVQLSDPITGISKIQPKFFGATNGKIVARIKGGTRISDDNQAYNYLWKKDGITFAGGDRTTQYTPFTGAPENNELEIILDKVPAGNYSLTVTDKNYVTAIANNANVTNSAGCSIIDLPIELLEPAKIEVTFVKTNPSCHAVNLYGQQADLVPLPNGDGIKDEAQNGKIIATVTGGVQYTGFENLGKPYKYFWQKKIAGVWTNIINENNVLENIGDGEYSFNIEDKNGYRLGTFDNIANIQSAVINVPNLIVQPAKLELAFTKTDVNCGGFKSGSAKAIPQGGVPPYTYQWNDELNSSSQEIENLASGNYFVLITDVNGCIVQGNINLPQPSDITISHVATDPKCFNGNNGAIDLKITGGNPPFTYVWNNNDEETQDIENLQSGNYSVLITDSKGCQFTHSATLINPVKIVINLGDDRTLCNDQKLDLDITINDANPVYDWSSANGFISDKPQVSLTQAGIYKAMVVTSLGCIAEDEIVITTSQVNIESEFFVTSQAYVGEEVILVNTSNPFGQNTEWVYPTDAIVVSQEPKFTVLKFETAGSKAVSLKQTQGDCFALYSKNINVEDRGNIPNSSNNNSPFIKDFLVTPIPVRSDGNFTVVINLQEISPIKLRLYSLVGQNAIIQKSETGAKNYVVDFNLNIASGTYVLVLETAKQTLIRKIIKE